MTTVIATTLIRNITVYTLISPGPYRLIITIATVITTTLIRNIMTVCTLISYRLVITITTVIATPLIRKNNRLYLNIPETVPPHYHYCHCYRYHSDPKYNDRLYLNIP